MKKNKTLRGMCFAAIAGVFWGFSGTVGQYLFSQRDISSEWLTIVRMIAGGAILLLVSLFSDRRALTGVWKTGKDGVRLVLFAVLGMMTCQYTYLTAIFHSNSGTATVLQYLGQLLILGYTCIRALRLPTKKETGAVLLALAGAFLLTTHGDLSTLALSREALLWGMAAAFTLMLYTLIPGDLIARFGSPVCTGYGLLIGGIALLLLTRGWRFSVKIDGTVVLCMALIILVGTVLAFTMYLQAVSDIGAVKACLLSCLEIVSATLFTVFWLGTTLTAEDILSFVLITCMVLLLAIPEKRKRVVEDTAEDTVQQGEA